MMLIDKENVKMENAVTLSTVIKMGTRLFSDGQYSKAQTSHKFYMKNMQPLQR